MSNLLDSLGIDFKLQNVSTDGNCFYHAVSKQFNGFVSYSHLRKIVSYTLNEEDLAVFNVINETSWTLRQFKRRVKKTGSNCLWADSIEINTLSRSMPHIGFIIFDEKCSVINKIEQNKYPKEFVYLLRKNMHYQSVLLSTRNKRRIEKLMHHNSNYQIKRVSKNIRYILTSFLLIPFWNILLQFLHGSLQHW
jgi:hypothetical protein